MSPIRKKSSARQIKQAMEWFVLLQSEQCDNDEHLRFAEWLAHSEANRAAYSEVEGLWSGMDGLKALPRHQLAAVGRAGASMRSGIILMLLVALPCGGWWLDYRVQPTLYATAQGKRNVVTLEDGSRIDLNTATRLSVRITPFRREVALEQGEALFDVAHETLRPFSVQAGGLRIRDIGTRFNVYKKPAETLVDVLEGAVELGGERLMQGYRRRYDGNGVLSVRESSDADRAGAWKDGRLVFKRTPLTEVVAELERYHPVHFLFADPRLARETLSGSFDADDLDPFLSAVEKIMPVRVTRTPQQIVLRWAKAK